MDIIRLIAAFGFLFLNFNFKNKNMANKLKKILVFAVITISVIVIFLFINYGFLVQFLTGTSVFCILFGIIIYIEFLTSPAIKIAKLTKEKKYKEAIALGESLSEDEIDIAEKTKTDFETSLPKNMLNIGKIMKFIIPFFSILVFLINLLVFVYMNSLSVVEQLFSGLDKLSLLDFTLVLLFLSVYLILIVFSCIFLKMFINDKNNVPAYWTAVFGEDDITKSHEKNTHQNKKRQLL